MKSIGHPIFARATRGFNAGRLASALAGVGICFALFPPTRTNADQVALAWNDNSSDEVGFKIERAAAGGGFAQIATVGADIITYVDTAVTIGTVYTYRVRAFNAAGDSAYSNSVRNAPTFTADPVSPVLVVPGGNASFAVAVSGSPLPSIQWQFSSNGGSSWTNVPNAAPYTGGTTTTLTLTSVSSEINGARFRAVASSSVGTVISDSAVLIVAASSRLANLSVRAVAGSGSNTLIVGFVIAGGSNKSLLVRGIGPTLSAFGVTGALDDPVLSLYSGSRLFDSNDDWGMAANATQIAPVSARWGAFALTAASRDAVVFSALGMGAFTAHVSGKGTASGIALMELYDADQGNASRLVNFSARTNVGTGANAPIVGFVTAGNATKQVLIRAIGPTLMGFGVTGVIPDPQLVLYRQGSATPLQQNDNWGGTTVLKSVFGATGAFALGDSSRDAALLVTLEPGAFTAQISGVNNTTGVALIEVYEVP